MSETSTTDAEHIINVAEELDLKIERAYSGRGMLGRTCLGVYINQFSDMGRVMFHLGAVNQDPDVNMTVEVFDWKYDNMGKGSWIMYWPNIEAPAAEEEVCPPCPNCHSDDTYFGHASAEKMGIETYYKGCYSCNHTWDPE